MGCPLVVLSVYTYTQYDLRLQWYYALSQKYHYFSYKHCYKKKRFYQSLEYDETPIEYKNEYICVIYGCKKASKIRLSESLLVIINWNPPTFTSADIYM